MTLVNRASFISTETDANGNQTGTVEVTLLGVTKRVKARHYPQDGWIIAYGVTGRYQTGAKAWPASITSKSNGSEFVQFGRDDRSGRFNKQNFIYFS